MSPPQRTSGRCFSPFSHLATYVDRVGQSLAARISVATPHSTHIASIFTSGCSIFKSTLSLCSLFRFGISIHPLRSSAQPSFSFSCTLHQPPVHSQSPLNANHQACPLATSVARADHQACPLAAHRSPQTKFITNSHGSRPLAHRIIPTAPILTKTLISWCSPP